MCSDTHLPRDAALPADQRPPCADAAPSPKPPPLPPPAPAAPTSCRGDAYALVGRLPPLPLPLPPRLNCPAPPLPPLPLPCDAEEPRDLAAADGGDAGRVWGCHGGAAGADSGLCCTRGCPPAPTPIPPAPAAAEASWPVSTL